MKRPLIPILVGLCVSAFQAPAQEELYREFLESGLRYLQTGKLNRARHEFEEIIADNADAEPGDEQPSIEILRACRQGLLHLDLIGGKYQEVLAAVGDLDEAERQARGFAILELEALLRSGQHAPAEALLDQLIKADANDLQALCQLGELQRETGRSEESVKTFRAIVDLAGRKSLRDGEQLSWVARAHTNLGTVRDLEQASMLLVEAIRVAPDLPSARIQYGKLRFAAYGEWSERQSGESILKEVLNRNGDVEAALIALYRIRKANHKLNPVTTDGYLRRALDLNPNSVAAMLERGIQLIDDRRFAAGAQMLDKALAINSKDQSALAQRSAAAYLMGDDDAAAAYRKRILDINAGSVVADIAFGNRLVRLYRFADSLSYYQAALERQPENIEALHGLGRALIYTGQGDQAGKVLRQAEDLQPGIVSPWRFNALAIESLLGEEYEIVKSDGFLFKIHRDERVVMENYLLPVMAEALETLGAKYAFKPDYPVVIEVLRTWDDFSVRTIGFRGFTALGACFGPMITLVSPADNDLRRQDFMWTATAWHEFAHVLTLALSGNRVPRWLTEGISVHEEGARNKSWERGMDRELLSMHRNGDIPPVRLLNGLFRGPRILEGYYLGGQIIDYLSREFGFDKVVEMLRYYAEDLSTEESFRRAFGISSAEFDRRFLTYVEEEKLAGLILQPNFGPVAIQNLQARLAADPKDLDAHIDLAWAYLQRGVEVDAASHLREVLVADPNHGMGKLVHAELLRRRGAIADAMQAYSQGFGTGADDFDSRIRYGKMLIEAGDVDGAARQFMAAKRCWPKCTDQKVAPSLLLAKLFGEAGRQTEAMMELKTFCSRTGRAFQPRLDLAAYARKEGDRKQESTLLEQALEIDPFSRSVHLNLADAYLAMNRKAEAMRELQMTLEISPKLDRGNLGKNPGDFPGPTDSEFLEEQAEICLRLGKGLHQLDRPDKAIDYLQRALREAPGSAAADAAEVLLETWR